jgi:hypothetical protein
MSCFKQGKSRQTPKQTQRRVSVIGLFAMNMSLRIIGSRRDLGGMSERVSET